MIMRRFKDLGGREKAEYAAIIALLPLFLLFRQLGKNIKWLSVRRRQLTACALCAVLILGVLPFTAFADSDRVTYISEFRVGNIKVDVESSTEDFWYYGTETGIVSRNVETLPESGWTWAIRANVMTADYTIKLNNYNGSYIMASSTKYYGNTKCRTSFEVSGSNTITSPTYCMRFTYCDIVLSGDGDLKLVSTSTMAALQANSLVVDLASDNSLDITASGTGNAKSYGITVSDGFLLQSGKVNINISNNSDTTGYDAVGLEASTVAVDGGSLNIASSNELGESYGIRGNYKRNAETNKGEYPADVTFNNGTVEISAGTMATNTVYPPVTADGFKLWAGSASDRSDKDIYDPAKFESYTYYTNEHIHCICGATSSHEKKNECRSYSPKTYLPWSDPTSLPDDSLNYYYLTTDVVLSNTFTVSHGMNLCLNGHSVTANGDFDAIRVGGSTTWATVTDCSELKYQGKITHAEGKTGSGIVCIGSYKYLIMYGGNITGNTTENGAGIYCADNGELDIYGGSITNNTATNAGGGIYNAGNVNLYACSITGNTADIGGGIFNGKATSSSEGGRLKLYGGTVMNNTAAQNGGGIYAESYVSLRGDGNSYDGQGKNYTTVSNNIAGDESNKTTNNTAFADGQCLMIYGGFKGGNVYLHYTGAGTVIAKHDSSSVNTYLFGVAADNLKCDDTRYMPTRGSDAKTIVLKTNLKQLKADDFEFSPPSGSYIYNGNPRTASITAKNGVDCGDITVKYYDEDHVRISQPTNAGKYTVSIDVEENDVYAEANNITDPNWTFTITPREVYSTRIMVVGVSNTYIYTGEEIRPVPIVSIEGVPAYSGRDYMVSYENNTNVGNAAAVITLQGNYSGSRRMEFYITYGHASNIMYSVSAPNENGWHNKDVIVSAKSGYSIGETPQSFTDSLTFTGDTARGGKQVFLKSASDGKVYRTIISYKLDTQAPTDLNIQYNENGFRAFLNRITFGLFFKDTVEVKATATDELSGIDKIQYFASDSEVQDPESITDWENSLIINAENKKLIYVKVTDKAGNSVIKLDQGVVVYSDSAVSPTDATFDLKTGNGRDIAFTLDTNSNTFRELRNGNAVLTRGTDYTVSENTVTVLKDYFARFGAGSVQSLTFVFDPLGVSGTDAVTATASVTITDSTHRHDPVKHAARTATCTNEGNVEYYTCKGCDGLFLDENCTTAVSEDRIIIRAYRHEGASRTAAVAEDCENGGNSAYWHCDRCGKYFADNNEALDDTVSYDNSSVFLRSATGHDWTDWSVTSPATFTEEGEESRTCKNCSKPQTRKIAKLVPKIIEGNNGRFKHGTDDALSFRCNMTLGNGTVIKVDGVAIASSSYNTVTDTTVTLLVDYLNTLTDGEHTISIETSEGTVSGVFTIKVDPGDSGIPKTGDSDGLIMWITFLFISGGAAAFIARRVKRRNNKRSAE